MLLKDKNGRNNVTRTETIDHIFGIYKLRITQPAHLPFKMFALSQLLPSIRFKL